ncbi:MAG TPA: hypothetical protein VJ783_25030 [Pirellulales bacterium]|nr:hypothetical protein [Pirellulales bacterium]
MWHRPTRQELFTLRQFDAVFHLALVFSPDGRQLTAATSDRDGRGRLLVWTTVSSNDGPLQPVANQRIP